MPQISPTNLTPPPRLILTGPPALIMPSDLSVYPFIQTDKVLAYELIHIIPLISWLRCLPRTRSNVGLLNIAKMFCYHNTQEAFWCRMSGLFDSFIHREPWHCSWLPVNV